MTNNQVLILVEAVRNLLIAPYPFPPNSDVDTRLCLVMGYAAGILQEGLSAIAEGRPVRLGLNDGLDTSPSL